MSLYLRDHQAMRDVERSHCWQTLKELGLLHLLDDSASPGIPAVAGDHQIPPDHLALPSTCCLLLHAEDVCSLQLWIEYFREREKQFARLSVILISSVGSDSPLHRNDFPPFVEPSSFSLRSFNGKDHPAGRKFVALIRERLGLSGESLEEPSPRAPLTPPQMVIQTAMPTQDTIAFRLLCEAWKLGHHGSPSTLGQNTLYFPSRLADWLDPFQPAGTTVQAKIEEIVHLVSPQDMAGKTRRVLDAANGEVNNFEAAIDDWLATSSATGLPPLPTVPPPPLPFESRLVLGQGSLPRVIGSILRCPVVPRGTDNYSWNWPTLSRAEQRRLIIIPERDDAVWRVIQWHRQARECPQSSDLSCLVFGMQEAMCSELLRRDIFGRKETTPGSSFSEWSHYVIAQSTDTSLRQMLASLGALKPCPSQTWKREMNEASMLAPLRSLIATRDAAGVRAIFTRAYMQDWDAILLGHANGNAVRKFLEAVRDELPIRACQWKEIESLLTGPDQQVKSNKV